MFHQCVFTEDPKPYNSFGNGAAMRVSAAGWFAESVDEVKTLTKAITAVTHNHSEGIKGAEATAMEIFHARQGMGKEAIAELLARDYYPLDFTIDGIRDTYQFNETCQDTVPQAIKAFLEGEDFEDVIRMAIPCGGDSDTLAAIAGSMAEAYYGVPEAIEKESLVYLDDTLMSIVERYRAGYRPGRR